MATPLLVAVAPNGARRTKADHPTLPLAPDEPARGAAACREAGATLADWPEDVPAEAWQRLSAGDGAEGSRAVL